MSKYIKRFKKVSPFKYPSKKHKRTQSPPHFLDYKLYKPFLKEEFFNKCVYCKKSDSLQYKGSFHVEHYRPKSIFPHLVTNYSNLYYSCAACNQFKGNKWFKEKNLQILNPCDYIMSFHLNFNDVEIIHRTEQGKNTVIALRLNNSESTDYRQKMKGLTINLLKLLGRVNLKKESQLVDQTIDQLAMLIGEPPELVKSALRI